jgi:hypothetical protein
VSALIRLDLRALSEDKIAEAMPNLKGCYYTTPCIIGVLVPPAKRAALDTYDDCSIDVLASEGAVKFPNRAQTRLATELQRAFDKGDEERLLALLVEVRRLGPLPSPAEQRHA